MSTDAARMEHTDERWGSKASGRHARPYDYALEQSVIREHGRSYAGRHHPAAWCCSGEPGGTCDADRHPMRELGSSVHAQTCATHEAHPDFQGPCDCKSSSSEPCGRGVCAAEQGHAGTCAEASGWAHDPYEDKPKSGGIGEGSDA